MAISYSESDPELRDRVRDALGGVSENLIKDGPVDQSNEWVESWMDNKIDAADHDQSDIDNAIVAYTAERVYKSIPAKSTISGGGVTANMAVQQYRRDLEQRTSEMLSILGITHPDKGRPAPLAKRTSGMFDDLR